MLALLTRSLGFCWGGCTRSRVLACTCVGFACVFWTARVASCHGRDTTTKYVQSFQIAADFHDLLDEVLPDADVRIGKENFAKEFWFYGLLEKSAAEVVRYLSLYL